MMSITKRKKTLPLIYALFFVSVISVSTDANFYAVEQDRAQVNVGTPLAQPSLRYDYYGALYAPQLYAQNNHNVAGPYGGSAGSLPSNVFTVVDGSPPRSVAKHAVGVAVASAYDPVSGGDRQWPFDGFQATTLPLSVLPPFSFPQIGVNAPSASNHRSQFRAKQQLEAMRAKAFGGDGDSKAATVVSERRVDMRSPERRRWSPPATSSEDESTEWTTRDRHPTSSFAIGKSRGHSAETVVRTNVVSKGMARSRPAFRSHRVVTSSVAAGEEESGEWEHRKEKKEQDFGSSDDDDDSEKQLAESKRRLEVEADEEVRRRSPTNHRTQQQQPESCRHPGCKAWITITFPGEQRKSEVKTTKKGSKNRPPKKFTFTTTTTTTTTTDAPPPPSSTKRSQPEFIFSTSWVVSLKRKTTDGPPGPFSATITTTPSDGSSSRGSVRPFTLKPSTSSQSRSGSSFITSATLVGPSVLVSSTSTTTGESPKSRNTIAGETEGDTASSTTTSTRSSLVSVGGSGGDGGNLDKTGSSRSQPWTHSSSRGGDQTVVSGSKSGLPKKAHRPTPITDASPTIEEAAIWASTELIDAIREALAKFRAALKNRRQQQPMATDRPSSSQLHAIEEEPIESDLLRAAWDELRTGTWLERQLAQLVMADATLLEESGTATDGGGGDDRNGHLVASVLPALMQRAATAAVAATHHADDAADDTLWFRPSTAYMN